MKSRGEMPSIVIFYKGLRNVQFFQLQIAISQGIFPTKGTTLAWGYDGVAQHPYLLFKVGCKMHSARLQREHTAFDFTSKKTPGFYTFILEQA